MRFVPSCFRWLTERQVRPVSARVTQLSLDVGPDDAYYRILHRGRVVYLFVNNIDIIPEDDRYDGRLVTRWIANFGSCNDDT